jgi:hypothetical protein
MNADGAVSDSPVTDVLTGVVADATVNRRQRIVPDEFTPCAFVVTVLRQRKPRLDILARRTGVVARWQEINVFRPAGTECARTSTVAR